MKYDVLGVGNAIVDVLATTSDQFLVDQRLDKGQMALIDAERASELYGLMGSAREVSGGSVANTCAGLASLGGRAVYVGRVCDDQLGEVFAHDIRAAGVDFFSRPADVGSAATARCLVLVTPDAQRTMNTYLGACVDLGPEDIDETLIASAQVTYLEGYLWDQDLAKEALTKAARSANQAGRQVALTLSDSFCVTRHRESFRKLIQTEVDILFANESELLALTECDSLEEALQAAQPDVETLAVTRSEKGSVVLGLEGRYEIPAQPVERLVDTTGAGDLYAAGFLFGMTHGRSLADCARIGSLAAAEVISHYGARPEVQLETLIPRAAE